MGHLLRNLKRMGHEVTVVCAYEDAPDVFEGLPVHKLPCFTPPLYKETRLAYPFPLLTLGRIYARVKPDIVHFVGPEFVIITFLLWNRVFQVPFLASYHWYFTAWLNAQTPITRFLTGWIGQVMVLLLLPPFLSPNFRPELHLFLLETLQFSRLCHHPQQPHEGYPEF